MDAKWVYAIQPEGEEVSAEDLGRAASLLNATGPCDGADFFVMPSRYEGYGLTLTEAMSLGLPVVTSTADSLPELCEQYKGGFAQCIDFHQDPDGIRLAKALSEAVNAGRSAPFILCSVASMVDQYESIYNELTGN